MTDKISFVMEVDETFGEEELLDNISEVLRKKIISIKRVM